MAVSHVGSQAGSGASTTGLTLLIPAGTQTDDVLFLSLMNAGAAADATVADNDSGGNTWALMHGRDNGTARAAVWWKRATANTASKTITISGCTDSCSGGVSVYRGASTGTPYEEAGSQLRGSGNETATGITTTQNGAMVCFSVFNHTNDNSLLSNVSTTSPGTLTTRFQHLSSGGNDSSCAHASEVLTTAGATGDFTWSQADAATTVIKWAVVPPTLTSYTIEAEAAAFILTGQDILFQRVMVAEVGAFVLTGQDVSFGSARTLDAGFGAFTLTGQNANLLYHRVLTAGTGEFLFTGQDVGIGRPRSIIADTGEFTLTSQDATFRRTYIMVADAGSFTLTGQDVTFTAEALPDATPIRVDESRAGFTRVEVSGTTHGRVDDGDISRRLRPE